MPGGRKTGMLQRPCRPKEREERSLHHDEGGGKKRDEKNVEKEKRRRLTHPATTREKEERPKLCRQRSERKEGRKIRHIVQIRCKKENRLTLSKRRKKRYYMTRAPKEEKRKGKKKTVCLLLISLKKNRSSMAKNGMKKNESRKEGDTFPVTCWKGHAFLRTEGEERVSDGQQRWTRERGRKRPLRRKKGSCFSLLSFGGKERKKEKSNIVAGEKKKKRRGLPYRNLAERVWKKEKSNGHQKRGNSYLCGWLEVRKRPALLTLKKKEEKNGKIEKGGGGGNYKSTKNLIGKK